MNLVWGRRPSEARWRRRAGSSSLTRRITAVSPTLSIDFDADPDAELDWTPDQDGCTHTLWYHTSPYDNYMVHTGTPESFDVEPALGDSSLNYFWSLEVNCDGTMATSNNLGEFTFDIVAGS